MKIALVSEHASPLATIGGVDAGGQNVYVAELACALGRQGHQVSVYTRRDDRALPAVVRAARNVDIVHVDAGPPVSLAKDELFPHMEAFGAELRRMWECDLPDLAHSHFWMSGLATERAAKCLGLPWLHTYHALGLEKRREQGAADTSPPERIACERRILRSADAIVATSSAELFEHRRTGGGRDLKLIPCGVAVDQFDAPPETMPARRERHRIVTLSRLVPRKGVDDVVRALAAVPETELIVGGGTQGLAREADADVARLHDLAIRHGVVERIVFAGPIARSDVPAFLASSDLVVCASVYEPFGLVPLEAMAARRPVVVTRVGGFVDTVVDGITGYHVSPGDPADLGRVLARLLPDATLLRDLGEAGRRRVERYYAWDTIAQRMADLYAAFAARGAVAGRGSA